VRFNVIFNRKMERNQTHLLYKAKKLDQRALAEIYDTYSTGLYGYALRLLGDPQTAEDCVAETFSRFLKTLHAGKGPNKQIKAYLYRIAHNWVADFYRRSPRQCLSLDEHPEISNAEYVEEQVDRRIIADQLRDALLQLTPDQRQVIMLVFIEGWRKDEVAAAVGKQVGAVKALQHRALKSLRSKLTFSEGEAQYESFRKLIRSTA
jgi:RNA polymerase sigma-70 factor (ECF subfamily)